MDLLPCAKLLFNKYTINEKTGCWDWHGSKTTLGYGAVSKTVNGKEKGLLAHRVMYVVFKGAIPEGKVVDHMCNNRGCVNPGHLQALTTWENVARSERSISVINKNKTHCKWGHELVPPNIYYPPERPGARYCRTCRDIKNKRRSDKSVKHEGSPNYYPA